MLQRQEGTRGQIGGDDTAVRNLNPLGQRLR